MMIFGCVGQVIEVAPFYNIFVVSVVLLAPIDGTTAFLCAIRCIAQAIYLYGIFAAYSNATIIIFSTSSLLQHSGRFILYSGWIGLSFRCLK